MILLLLALCAHALDLDEARRIAVERSLEVEMAQARAQAARASAWEVTGGALPSVAAFVDVSTGAGTTAFGFERPVRTLTGVGVTGRWTVLAPGSWAAAVAARRSALGQVAMLDWARVQARREATVAYGAAWAAAAEAEAWRSAEEDAERGLEAVRSLVDAGLRPPPDLLRARADHARTRARRVRADGSARSRCAELQGLLRHEVTGICALDDVQWAEPEPAGGEHPALVASREAWRAAKAGATAAVLDMGPTVSVDGTFAQYQVAGGEPGTGWSAGLGVDVPIVAGGSGHAARVAASAEAREMLAALREQEIELQTAAVSARARHDAAVATVEALRDAVRAADEAHRAVDERYRAGLDGVTAWLDARRARDEVRAEAAAAEAELAAALAEVEAARGVW